MVEYLNYSLGDMVSILVEDQLVELIFQFLHHLLLSIDVTLQLLYHFLHHPASIVVQTHKQNLLNDYFLHFYPLIFSANIQ